MFFKARLYSAIMYFYNVFFIIFFTSQIKNLSLDPSSQSDFGPLGPVEVRLSLARQESGHPCSTNLPHSNAGGWQEESTPSWVKISRLLFHEGTQLGGLALLLI